MARETKDEAVAPFNSAVINENDMKSLWKFSKQIRKEILSKNWESAETFDKYELLKILCMFLKWVLIGPHNSDRDNNIKHWTLTILLSRITK